MKQPNDALHALCLALLLAGSEHIRSGLQGEALSGGEGDDLAIGGAGNDIIVADAGAYDIDGDDVLVVMNCHHASADFRATNDERWRAAA